MQLVLAHHPGQRGRPVRSLGVEERLALERHYRDDLDAPWLAEWLAQAHRMAVWIACDCRSPDDLPPIMFIRAVREDSSYALTPMTDRPPHHTSCPFRVPRSHGARTYCTRGHSELRTLLLRWFSAARLNLRYPFAGGDAIGMQYAALREVSRSMQLSRGRSLYDYSRTHPLGLPELCRLLSSSTEGSEVGIFMAVVDALDWTSLHEALQIDSGCAEWMDGTSMPEVECAGTSGVGPFAVLFRLKSHRNRVMIECAMAQAVQSEHILVPVDSTRERRTLEILLEVQRWLLVTHHRIIMIRKTLADSLIHSQGIGFQIQLLGPNGRAQQSIDIVSASETAPLSDDDLQGQTDPMYHVVETEPSSQSDLHFRCRLMQELLRRANEMNEPHGRRWPRSVSH